MESEIAKVMSFDRIRYSQVWEDHLLLSEGLQLNDEDDVLSICSAGCNTLALLLEGVRSVTAIDINPSQTALLELKLAGIRVLSHPEFTCLMGVRTGHDRSQLFDRLKKTLSEAVVAFWEANIDDIEKGIIHSGRLEIYFQMFRKEHLPELWPGDLLSRLLAKQSLQKQADLYRSEAATPEFEERFRWYFGREKMAEQGRDPAQFAHVNEGDVGGYFFRRFSEACTRYPLHRNFYLEHFLTADYRDLCLAPPYLMPQNFQRLKTLVDRVHIHNGELESYLSSQPHGRFSKANLSDIFEYMSEELSEAVFRSLGTQLRAGGRIAYWNLLVPRHSPDNLRSLLCPLVELSRDLHSRDRLWLYRAFHVETVQ